MLITSLAMYTNAAAKASLFVRAYEAYNRKDKNARKKQISAFRIIPFVFSICICSC